MDQRTNMSCFGGGFFERLRFRIPAGVSGQCSSPELTLRADSFSVSGAFLLSFVIYLFYGRIFCLFVARKRQYFSEICVSSVIVFTFTLLCVLMSQLC